MEFTTREAYIKAFADIILESIGSISFRILEIGAAQYAEQSESFYQLLDLFPGSEVIAFEIDQQLCDEQNKTAQQGIRFFPVALGRTEETRTFYRTLHPQCSSLYRPNEKMLDNYLNMEMARLEQITEIETISLDRFVADNHIEDIDFIKIDIQGAELDVFQGGVTALSDVVMIISEAEFVPHYLDQPLFGDVCGFLAERGLMFHKFLGFGGRALKPFVIDKNPNRPSQLLWSDAIFVKDIQRLATISVDKLLKLSVLGLLYGSPDLAYRCISIVDKVNQTDLGSQFLKLLAPRA